MRTRSTRPTAGAIWKPRRSIKAPARSGDASGRAIAGARGTAVGTGKQNTVDMLAECAERGAAADLCANVTVKGVRGWFLPSRDELALMYRNLKTAGVGDFRDGGTADTCCERLAGAERARRRQRIADRHVAHQHRGRAPEQGVQVRRQEKRNCSPRRSTCSMSRRHTHSSSANTNNESPDTMDTYCRLPTR